MLIVATGTLFAETKDFQQTLEAAQRGDAEAQYDLACMYVNGNKVEQNLAKAARWFRKAAEQGHALSQAGLGFMYSNG